MRPFFLSFFVSVALFSSQSRGKTILILGDSLTEGYGVAREQAYPALVEKKLRESGESKAKVINAGVSGSTSASAISRLKWQMKQKPDWVLIALGANDGLRGLKDSDLEKNLAGAISYVKSQNVRVAVLGMMLPPNYSSDYAQKFREVFPAVAKKYKVPLMPFLLEGVAGNSSLNLPDGIHPNEKGHRVMSENVYKFVKELL
jgi:acyl-CoA thioesterase-1